MKFLNEYDDIERKSLLLYSRAVEKAGRQWQDIFLQLKRRNLNRGFQVGLLLEIFVGCGMREGVQVIFEGIRNGNAVKSSFLIRLDDVGVLRDKCPKDSHYAETVAGRALD